MPVTIRESRDAREVLRLEFAEQPPIVARPCRRDRQPRVLVVIGHLGGFSLPVVGVVLYDAQRVDPDVIHAEFRGELVSMREERCRHGCLAALARNGGAFLSPAVVVPLQRPHDLGVGAPAVAQGYVLALLAFRLA